MNSITAAEKLRTRALEAEKMLENLHHHLVNVEMRLDTLENVQLEVLSGIDDLHTHISAIDMNVQILADEKEEKKDEACACGQDDFEELPELENVD